MTTAMPTAIIFTYLASAICFIMGLKLLSSPKTARNGNLVATAGMILAVGATLFIPGLRISPLLIGGLAIGIVLGVVGARWVRMTDMPQMVATLNGLGGGAAALVAVAEFWHATSHGVVQPPEAIGAEIFGVVIGSLSFFGSLVAFGKLQGILPEKAIASIALRGLNILLAITIVVLIGMIATGAGMNVFLALFAAALVFGFMMVIPIGGADMPVVISLLNAFTGLAAASTGFVLGNNVLIISGTLVGASGTLLTVLMCRAMNRSLANVLFGGFGAGAPATSGGAAGTTGGTHREITSEDAAVLLANIQSLIVVPGYGMAVAQAQHAVRELADMLNERGVEVKYAIHPVAGRMPGHMNVLLAEANVPYTQLFDLDAINPDFEHADVALVIGANDVVNPSARSDKTSPIYGMPILDADKAKHCIIIKRSMKPGFAGIDNPLYYEPKTMMLFGDARGAVTKLVEEIRNAAA